MAHESRLKVGVDVPWVTSWTAEPMLGVGPCPTVAGAPAVHQAQNPGVGRPNYSQNHMNRQRESVWRMLCPMCGEPTPSDDRWSQTGRWTDALALRRAGLGHLLPGVAELPDGARVFDGGAIAPCHLACAKRALSHCPHLGAAADQRLKRFPDRWLIAPLNVPATPNTPAAGRNVPIAAFLQLYGLNRSAMARVRHQA